MTTNIYDMTDTWTAVGTTYTSIKMNATDTASAAGSLLMDLQLGGVSKLNVGKNGNLAQALGDNISALASTGYNLTGTDATNLIDLAGTWNTSGSPTGIKLNITDTASGGSSRLLSLQRSGADAFFVDRFGNTTSAGGMRFGGTGADITIDWASPDVALAAASTLQWSSTSQATGSIDTKITRVGAGIVGVRGSSTSVGGALNFLEQTAPASPSADQASLYIEDNGSGKTRLVVKFSSGAAQQLAIQP